MACVLHVHAHTRIHSSCMLAMQLLCRPVVLGHPYLWLCCMCLLLVLLLVLFFVVVLFWFGFFCCCSISLRVCLQVLLVVLHRGHGCLLFGFCRCSSWLSVFLIVLSDSFFLFLSHFFFFALPISLSPCQVQHYIICKVL